MLLCDVYPPALGRIPVIFYGVVCSTRQHLGDLRPLVPMHAVRPHQDFLLGSGPRVLFDRRIQLIVPSTMMVGIINSTKNKHI